ncbi:MAG: LPS assembly lipoprotein LptE [Alphaproteobacteria bacterium]|nr:LPS assembly lipoprotein LptE [Alphaproteobacteria bacterium]
MTLNFGFFTILNRVFSRYGSLILIFLFFTESCKVYSFTDATIPPSIKTFKVLPVENLAPYINPVLAPTLTTSILQNIVNKTKLVGVRGSNEADYVIKGTIVEYNPNIIVGVSSSGSSQNALKISMEFVVTNTQNNEESAYQLTRSWPYDYSQSLSQVESSLLPEIVKSFSDDLFNKMFSNW